MFSRSPGGLGFHRFLVSGVPATLKAVRPYAYWVFTSICLDLQNDIDGCIFHGTLLRNLQRTPAVSTFKMKSQAKLTSLFGAICE